MDDRPWLARVVNPGVRWWVALPCNLVAGLALVYLIINPGNLAIPLALLGPAAILLYGTALAKWLTRRARE